MERDGWNYDDLDCEECDEFIKEKTDYKSNDEFNTTDDEQGANI